MMIHRIEGAYLRTQDSLSKREKDGRRRSRRPESKKPVPSKPEEAAEETAPARDHEADEATLDLVA